MRLDASALRALNLLEASGSGVGICVPNSLLISSRAMLDVKQEHHPVRPVEQVQDGARCQTAWELAQATTGEPA